MNLSIADIPELDVLSAKLKSAIEKGGVLGGDLLVTSRQVNKYYSTFPSEIITCRLGSGREIRLFCKYSTEVGHEAFGHRGGVRYEADVYHKLLKHLDVSCPTLYGIYLEPIHNRTGLVLEYLADNTRVAHSSDLRAMEKAVRWISKFHKMCSLRVSNSALSFLRTYDRSYYTGWLRRSLQIIERSGLDSQWLEQIRYRFDQVIEALFRSPSTIIHGEYYSENILLHDSRVYPVDWESTAVGCGEIDLVTLVEGWDKDSTERLVLEYQRSRWPEGPPHDFRRSLCAAKIYIQLRWLGDRPDKTLDEQYRLDVLRASAHEMGLL